MDLDFALTCRSCLHQAESDDRMQSLFAYHQLEHEWAEMLQDCTGTEINVKDGLPTSICPQCCAQLTAAFAFRLKCVQSHGTLVAIHCRNSKSIKADLTTDSEPFVRLEEVFLDSILHVKSEANAPEQHGLDDGAIGSEADEQKHVAEKHLKTPTTTTTDGPTKFVIMDPRTISDDDIKETPTEPVAPETPASDDVDLTRVHACPDCDKVFRRRLHMTRHQLIHSDVRPFGCTICDKRFRREDHLRNHMHHHAAKKPHTCSECGHGFTQAHHLKAHVKAKHTKKAPVIGTTAVVVANESPPASTSAKQLDADDADDDGGDGARFCSICKRAFSSAKYLAVHHHQQHVRKFQCKICAHLCADKESLIEHNRDHDGDFERPFLCSECGMRFVRNDYLKIHMRRHKGEKPYKCRYCGKGFPRSTDLTVHERYHTGEKAHLCTTCGKGFHRAYNLVLHIRTHTGERPYQCPHCERSFAQSNDLKAHVRRHTGERYKCDVCGEGFIQGYHLTQHKQKVHGLDVQSHIQRLEKFGATTRQQRNADDSDEDGDDGGEPVEMDDGASEVEVGEVEVEGEEGEADVIEAGADAGMFILNDLPGLEYSHDNDIS